MEYRLDPVLDKPTDFSFFTPAVFHKGGDGSIRSVEGVISTDDLDIQQEQMIQDGLDLSYFLEKGVIKFEHNKKDAPPTSKNIIGYPLDVKKGDHSTTFTGEIFPEADGNGEADSAWKLLKSTAAFNKRNPEHQKSLGWSIEGQYKRRTEDGVVEGATVTNVVLTANPINTNTVATIAKSLEAGYGTSPESQTGGGAIRKESLASTLKNQSVKGGTKMDKCKCGSDSYEKCMSYHKSQGMEDDKAGAAAKEHYPQMSKSADNKELLKAIETHTDLLEKDTEYFKGLINDIAEFKPTEPIPVVEKPAPDEAGFIDVTKDVANILKSMSAIEERSVNSDGVFMKGFEQIGSIVSSSARIAAEAAKVQSADHERIDALAKSVDTLQESLNTILVMTKAIGGQEITHDVTNLLNPNSDGEGAPEGAEALLKNNGFVIQSLEKGITDNQISPNSITEFEMTRNVTMINKAAQDYIINAARSQAAS